MKNLKEKCQEFDQIELTEMLVKFPMLTEFINENIKGFASIKSVELIDELDADNQVLGFDCDSLQNIINVYIEETYSDNPSIDELDTDDWENIKIDIKGNLECNCEKTEELIDDIELKKWLKN